MNQTTIFPEQSGDLKNRPRIQKKILCLWLPNWPIQRLVVENGALRKTQIVLYQNRPGRGQWVTAVSPAAGLHGARIGMPLSEARCLLGRGRQFTEYHVFEHQPANDLRCLRQLAIECQRFSPIVGLDEEPNPCSLLLDLDGVGHLFGGDDALRFQIHRHFESLGYMVSTAVAATIGKAWALARFGATSDICSASDGEISSQEKDPFDALAVAALRLPEDMVDTLSQLGVQQVGQIRSLPRSGLLSRFGDQITRRLDQADGQLPEVIQAVHPPADYRAQQYLDYPIHDCESIEALVSRLADQLCRQMRAAGRGGLSWEFQLDGPPEQNAPTTSSSVADENSLQMDAAESSQLRFTVKLFQPTATLDHLMPLVKMQMEDLFGEDLFGKRSGKDRFQVQQVTVSVRNCVLLQERQRQLFDESPRLDQQTLAHLINRLSSRLGDQHVLRPVLQSGAAAEDACYFEPLVGQNQKSSTRSPRRKPGHGQVSPLQRPLHLLVRPESIQVGLLPQTESPASVIYQGQRWDISRRWGPERIETAWWRGPTVRRDYWRIETQCGRWWWIYRDLRRRRWYLHGEF